MGRKIFLSVFLILLVGLVSKGWAGSSISQATNWAYQLQAAIPAQLAASKYEVIVIDYSRDGTDAGAYKAGQIKSIQDKGKIVLAYLSIGEAEDYRFYWQPSWHPGNPPWLGPQNPDWPGNYKVRYWYPGWWTQVLKPYLDRILQAGFDGVYLDIIDAYWYWHQKVPLPVTFTADKMVALVEKIAAYTQALHPGFILCPQNGESIIDDVSAESVAGRYFRAIEALGVEDLFYHYGTHQDQVYRLQLLKRYRTAGKTVFNVEYVGRTRWAEYLHLICAAGVKIISYAARPDRALDELIKDFPQLNCDQQLP